MRDRLPGRSTSTTTRQPSAITAAPDTSLTSDSGAPALTIASTAGLAIQDDIEPPDPWVAAGPDNVVQMVNVSVQIRNRRGSGTTNVTLPDFFGLPTNPVTYDADGRIVFDSLHNRWIASELSYDCDTTQGDADFGHGYLDVAVSRTADPKGLWDITYTYLPDFLYDFPSLGTSTDKVAIGANVYDMAPESSPGAGDCIDPAGFETGAIASWSWSDLLKLATTPTDPIALLLPSGFAPRVALQAPATTATLFVVSATGDTGRDVGYQTVTGTGNATSLAADFDLTTSDIVTAFVDPVAPTQPGTPSTIADAADYRPTDAVWRQSRLVFTSTTSCMPAGDDTSRDCARFTELATAAATASPTLRQDLAVGDDGADSFMPGAGYAGDGTLHLAWTRSSASSFASSMAAYQRTGDAVNSISTPQVVAAGAATYDGTRWGDYVGVAQDPQVPDAVWQANEYASADGLWATKVSQLQTGGLRYVPITPVRVLDSRPGGTGLSGKFSHGTPRSFPVGGVSGIPSTARAVTGNVTVVNQQAGGFVSITPLSVSAPATSTINFPSGDVRANNVTATLGAGGKLWAVYRASTSKTTDLVFDVTGYYLDDDSEAAYSAISPVRMLDTRSPAIGLTSPFHGGTPRRLALGDVSVGGSVRVPNTAIAITGNLTVVNQKRSGFVAITTTSQPAPSTSTLNFPVGDVRANGVTVPLDDDATHRGIWIVYRPTGGLSSDTADLILDVTGYYTKSGGGAEFHPLNPGRTMDSRSGAVLSGIGGKFHALTPRTLDVDGRWGVPTGATAITGNLTVVGETKGGYVSVTKDPPASTPTTSTINFPLGDIRANGITVPLSTSPAGNVSLDYAGAPSTATTDLILDLSGYFK
ncbi:MAG TPA: hypothetical protein VFI28_13405 [Candidatus Limnocylindrales bacterium]|nr:hypothetical protein [Candidatus Limnocylindrales bacterium]